VVAEIVVAVVLVIVFVLRRLFDWLREPREQEVSMRRDVGVTVNAEPVPVDQFRHARRVPG
jgi:hypothetical protein